MSLHDFRSSQAEIKIEQQEENIATGVLTDGKWQIHKQTKNVDHYKVKYQEKSFDVFAEMHCKREAEETLNSFLNTIQQKTKEWFCYIENNIQKNNQLFQKILSLIPKENKQLLPDRYSALPELVKSKKLILEEIELALAVEQMSMVGRLLNSDEHRSFITEERKQKLIQFVSIPELSKIVTNLLSEYFPKINIDEVEKLLKGKLLETEIDQLIKTANNVLALANEKANNQQAKIIRDTLGSTKVPNIFIIIGKGHLGSLIGVGELAAYTLQALEEKKEKPEELQSAFELISKNKILKNQDNEKEEIKRQKFIDRQIYSFEQGIKKIEEILQKNTVSTEIRSLIQQIALKELNWLKEEPYTRYREFNAKKREELANDLKDPLQCVVRYLVSIKPNNYDTIVDLLLRQFRQQMGLYRIKRENFLKQTL